MERTSDVNDPGSGVLLRRRVERGATPSTAAGTMRRPLAVLGVILASRADHRCAVPAPVTTGGEAAEGRATVVAGVAAPAEAVVAAAIGAGPRGNMA